MSEITEPEGQNLHEIIDALPLEDKTKLSSDYTKWHNVVIALYKKEFGLKDSEADPDPTKPAWVRTFKSEDEVIMFFREALLWWYRRKPKIGDTMSLLDALKTRECLGQIQGMKRRLAETGIHISRLKIADNLDEIKMAPVAH